MVKMKLHIEQHRVQKITGDYNKYAYVKKLKINDADVTIKGNGTKVYNVLCTKNDVTYSVFARQ